MTGYNLLSTMDRVFSQSFLWDIALAFLGLFLFSCIQERIFNKGPMLWPVLGIIPTMSLHLNDILSFVTRSLIRSGGTFHYRGVWMGGAHGVMTADPVNIEYMVKTNFGNFPKGRYYRETFWDLLGDGIFNADAELWKDQRRQAKTEMHSSRFIYHSFQTMQDLVHQKLLKVTEKLVKSGDSFDLQEILLRFTFDNICTAAFGVDPGCLNLDLPEVPFAKAFEAATELTLSRFLMPPFFWKPMKFFGIGHEKRLTAAIHIVHEFADETVKNRRNELIKLGSLNDQSDLLSRLMDIEYTENGKNLEEFHDKYFRDFCVSFILAGRDTTSVALAWFFWLVNNHPDVEKEILHEINEILGNRDHENQNNEIVFTVEELKKMVYLQAALSESMRLYPSVPTELKEVIEDDVLPDGSVLKKGARVLYSIFSMGRMESIWGKDCLEFKPERWIKEGKFVSENQYKYAVFNAGPRLCLGKRFAYMQMKMVAASILLRYSVKVVKGHVVVPKMTTTLYMKDGLLVTLKPREL
ncbi:cytochrome P450 86B1-like [Euphorbia lathyris]|uniref:cytochrome P450 86B1-like n=1 Tax=Euphorbia lathyris TaxID=212925 RepID=UPI00331389C7